MKDPREGIVIGASTVLSTASNSTASLMQALHSNLPTEANKPYFHIPLETADLTCDSRLPRKIARWDRSSLLAAHTALQLGARNPDLLVAATSRGSCELLESSIANQIQKMKPKPFFSPATTISSIGSAIAHCLDFEQSVVTLSNACASGLTAIDYAFTQISCYGIKEALVVAAEAPLTPYVTKIIGSAGVLSSYQNAEGNFNCLPFHQPPTGMILSESSAALLLKRKLLQTGDVSIAGAAIQRDQASPTGISQDATGLQRAIIMAANRASIQLSDIDIVLTHGSGTAKGDAAELRAYKKLFQGQIPYLMTDKWLVGHSLAPSSLITTAIATQCLKQEKFFAAPYTSPLSNQKEPDRFRFALVCSLAFGGYSAAVVLKKHQH